MEIDNNKNEICVPWKKYERSSCFTIEDLKKLVEYYNKYIDKEGGEKIKIKEDDKLYLLKELTKKLEKKCPSKDNNHHICWIKQEFIKDAELKKYTFMPNGPQKKFEWLSNFNIDDLMEIYMKFYNNYKYLGSVPIDVDDLEEYGIKNLDINKLKNEGKTKLGIIFNLDEHWKSGSHWVALYIDINKGKIYFFDSYGEKPEKRIKIIINRFFKYFKLNKINVEYKYNHIRKQYKNSECGVYSINFLLRLLKGEIFESIIYKKLTDDDVHKCRKKYFI